MKKLFTLAIIAMIASVAFAQKSVKSNLGSPIKNPFSASAVLNSKGGMMKAPETEPVWGNWAKESTGIFYYDGIWTGYMRLDIQVRYATNVENLAQVLLVGWGEDETWDMIFEWNTATNDLSVPVQNTGHEDSAYGYIYISDIATYTGEPHFASEYPCVYDPATMTFSFNLIYSFTMGYLGNTLEKFVLDAPLQDIPPHVHSWAEAWTQTETAHYHTCTAKYCDITDYSTAPAEAAYAEHEYGTDINETAYYTCSVCEYENDIRRQGYVDAIAAGAVVAKIEAIGTVEFTEECRILIDSARAAYEALTNDQKALITDEQLQVLIDAETTYNLMALAQPVIDLIDAIDTIDDLYLDAQSIAAARNAYDALIPEAQAYVTNYDALLEAEQKYSEMSDFYVYRNFRAIALGIIAQPAANLEVREMAVEAEQLLQALEYEPELTLEQNKANVDEIYYIYRDAIRAIRKQIATAAIFDAAKTAGKANIRLFLGLSRSEGAAAAAEEGIAAIDALEYDNDADIIANIDDVNDIVIDTKVAIVKAWIADFNAIRSAISASLRQTSADKAAEVEALSYDRNQTYDENVAKLNAFAQNEVTAIEAVGTTAARHNGKYIENGKIVIVKDGKTYTAGGQVK